MATRADSWATTCAHNGVERMQSSWKGVRRAGGADPVGVPRAVRRKPGVAARWASTCPVVLRQRSSRQLGVRHEYTAHDSARQLSQFREHRSPRRCHSTLAPCCPTRAPRELARRAGIRPRALGQGRGEVASGARGRRWIEPTVPAREDVDEARRLGRLRPATSPTCVNRCRVRASTREIAPRARGRRHLATRRQQDPSSAAVGSAGACRSGPLPTVGIARPAFADSVSWRRDDRRACRAGTGGRRDGDTERDGTVPSAPRALRWARRGARLLRCAAKPRPAAMRL